MLWLAYVQSCASQLNVMISLRNHKMILCIRFFFHLSTQNETITGKQEVYIPLSLRGRQTPTPPITIRLFHLLNYKIGVKSIFNPSNFINHLLNPSSLHSDFSHVVRWLAEQDKNAEVDMLTCWVHLQVDSSSLLVGGIVVGASSASTKAVVGLPCGSQWRQRLGWGRSHWSPPIRAAPWHWRHL